MAISCKAMNGSRIRMAGVPLEPPKRSAPIPRIKLRVLSEIGQQIVIPADASHRVCYVAHGAVKVTLAHGECSYQAL